MEYANTTRRTTTKGCLTGFIIIVLSVFVCTGSFVAFLDVSCYSDSGDYIVTYPDSTLYSEDYDLLRARGMGDTEQVYYTERLQQEVRGWYISNALPSVQKTRFGQITRSLSSGREGGTYITIEYSCAANI